jgi:nucleotide-binding universal stress UspA family protein
MHENVLRKDAVATARRLLCATDLTERSDHAVQRTAQLARQLDARAVFVHAVDDTEPERVIRMKVNRAHVLLTSQSERAMSHAPQNATASVHLGKPLHALTSAATRHDPDLIVMAAPRLRRVDAVFGTTAERVIRGTRQSVLLVGGPAERAYERVVLAADLSSSSTHVARTMMDLGVLQNGRAWVVHAFNPPYHEIVTRDQLAEDQASMHRRVWSETVRREVLMNLAAAGVDLARVHATAEPGDPFAAIQRATEQVRPDLLVIGVSRWFLLKRLLLGSVADRVFRNVSCDILAIAPARSERRLDLGA